MTSTSLSKSYKTVLNHFLRCRVDTDFLVDGPNDADNVNEVIRSFMTSTDAEFTSMASAEMNNNALLLQILKSEDGPQNVYHALQHFFLYLISLKKPVAETEDAAQQRADGVQYEETSPWYSYSTVQKYFTSFKSYLHSSVRKDKPLNETRCMKIRDDVLKRVATRSEKYAYIDNKAYPLLREMRNDVTRGMYEHSYSTKTIQDVCIIMYSWYVMARSSDCEFLQKRQLGADKGVLRINAVAVAAGLDIEGVRQALCSSSIAMYSAFQLSNIGDI